MKAQLPPLHFHEAMRLRRDVGGEEIPGGHLTGEQLAALALPGGMQDAGNDLLDHLSSCTSCMRQWGDQVKGRRSMSGDGAADDWYSGGMLEAAASGPAAGPVQLISSCEQFRLGVLPAERGDKGLVTLDVIDATLVGLTESCQVEVRDSNGRVVLAGTIGGGRCAGFCETVPDLDLSTWSLVIKPAAVGPEE